MCDIYITHIKAFKNKFANISMGDENNNNQNLNNLNINMETENKYLTFTNNKQFKKLKEQIGFTGKGRNKNQPDGFSQTYKRFVKEYVDRRNYSRNVFNTASQLAIDLGTDRLQQNTYRRNIINFISNENADNIDIDFTVFKQLKRIDVIKKLFNNLPFNRSIKIKYGDKYYTLNPTTYNNLLSILDNDIELIGDGNSDEEIIDFIINGSGIITFTRTANANVNPALNLVNNLGVPQQGGAFFPYTHHMNTPKLSLLLEDYGIYEEVDSTHYKDSCLIKALELGKCPKTIIDKLKLEMKNKKVPQALLKDVCNKFKICIKLKKLNNSRAKVITFGNKEHKTFEIGLIEEHYFCINKTNFTSYSIKNYNNISHIDEFNKIDKKVKGKYQKSNDRFIDSFELIKLLVENKELYLSPIKSCEEIYKTTYYNDKRVLDGIDLSSFTEDNFQPIIYKPKSSCFRSSYVVIYFDFETLTDENNNIIAYACSYMFSSDKKSRVFYNSNSSKFDCAERMLYDIKKRMEGYGVDNAFMVAHNCGFDFRCICNVLNVRDVIQKNNSLICADATYKGINFKFKCSNMLINAPLSKFGSMFGIDMDKEVFPYDMVNEDTIINYKFPTLNELSKSQYLQGDNFNKFVSNAKKWNCYITDNKEPQVNLLTYSGRYCMIDVIVLKKGYEKFGELMKEITKDKDDETGETGFDINNFYSIASLSQEHLIKQGCYEGVYQISGVVQQFIQKCVVGGRCMVANNQKVHIKDKVADYDKVSLYPNAMSRMGGFNNGEFIKGYLKGVPKIITNDIDLNKVDGYFVKIKLLSVNHKYHIPCMSKVNKSGIREWTNNMVGEICYVDKTTLEDWVNFHKITYEVIEGYYFDSGRNDTVCKVITDIFNKRVQYKKQKNPIQNLYKLIMNTGYGKTIIKPIDTDDEYINNDKVCITEYHMDLAQKSFDIWGCGNVKYTIINLNKTSKEKGFGLDYFYNKHTNKIEIKNNSSFRYEGMNAVDKFINNHYDNIKEVNLCLDGRRTVVKLIKPINEHFNIPQVGVEILSYSKRIMFEPMTLAEDNGIDLFYTDTDSIHLLYNDVDKINKLFKEKYGYELTGEEFNQFHIDFEMKGCKDVFSTEFNGLSKKVYIDKLQGTDIETGEIKTAYHIRMKGVSEGAILNRVNIPFTQKINDIISSHNFHNNPLELFEFLKDKDNSLVLDLAKTFYENKEGEFEECNKFKVEYKQFDMIQKMKFERKVNFKNVDIDWNIYT